MTVSIQVARSPEALDALFRARQLVLAEIGDALPVSPSGRVVDRFDALPTTRNVIAEHHGDVIGGVRITLPSPAGTPAEEQYDFAEVMHGCPYAAVSLLFVEPLYRGTSVSRRLLEFGASWASLNRCTHLIGVSSRSALPAFVRSGFRELGPTPRPEHDGEAPVPVVLDLRTLGGYLQLLSRGLDLDTRTTVSLAM